MKTKQRTLAVLLVLVLVLGGLLWFVSRSNAAEEAASSAAAEGSILLSSFAAGDVTSIRYAYGGETLTLNYDSGSWTLADDPDYHLDASACNTMVTALASLNAKRQLTGQPGEDFRRCDNVGHPRRKSDRGKETRRTRKRENQEFQPPVSEQKDAERQAQQGDPIWNGFIRAQPGRSKRNSRAGRRRSDRRHVHFLFLSFGEWRKPEARVSG